MAALARNIRRDLERWPGPAAVTQEPESRDDAKSYLDFLLIDARTGFQELVDLSLGYLADDFVIVSGLNE